MDRVARLIGLAAAFLAIVLVPGLARAVDAVAPVPTREYSSSCINGVAFTGNLGAFISTCTARFIAQQTYGTTFDGCPVTRSLSGTSSVDSDSGTSTSLRFTGTISYSPGGTGACATKTYPTGSMNQVFVSAGYVQKMGCEEGSHAVTGNLCACDPGWNVQSGKCKQYTCPPSGSYSAVTQPDQKVANAGDGQCSGGCSYTPSSWKVGNDGQIWATWPFKSTGKFCGGDPKPGTTDVDSGEKNTKNPAPVPCGTNQCPGTVNGQAVCVPCKGQQEQGPSTSASAPAGAAAGAQTGSSDTKTSCDGVTCTTTTTTKDGSGAVTGTADKTQKQESFCKENPQSSLCKQSSFGGSCGAVTCEGDAIQCAMAAEQHKRNCEWFDDAGLQPLKTTGAAAMTGQDQPDGHPARTADSQALSFSSAIDQTDRLGSGCPQDVTLTIGGQAVVLPFSQSCAPLQLLGQLAVAFTMLVCVFIVFR